MVSVIPPLTDHRGQNAVGRDILLNRRTSEGRIILLWQNKQKWF